VALLADSATIRLALTRAPLYTLAASSPLSHRYDGRLPTYSLPLSALTEGGPLTSSHPRSGDGGENRVVIRHSHHGGAFAAVTRDLFVAPTRAPHELATSVRLRAATVATPEIVAYAIYRVAPLLRRADVVTREIPNADDLDALLRREISTGADTAPIWTAVSALLASLDAANAHHADLNIKNILVDTANKAWLLDVDRVTFTPAPRPANEARLARSLAKWRTTTGLSDPSLDAYLASLHA
jgi:3-deoxy-D-manno-octulosonic acid kinase